MPVTGLIYREAEIMSCFAVLTAGGESEILPTDWGAKHPDGRVCKSYPAERRRDNPSEGEFIKVRYSIHNHTFWTKLDLCETMFALYSACPVSEFASALFPLLWSWSVTQTHAVLRTPQTNLFFFLPPLCAYVHVQVWRSSGGGRTGLPGDERQPAQDHAGQAELRPSDSRRARRSLPHQNQSGGAAGGVNQVEIYIYISISISFLVTPRLSVSFQMLNIGSKWLHIKPTSTEESAAGCDY